MKYIEQMTDKEIAVRILAAGNREIVEELVDHLIDVGEIPSEKEDVVEAWCDQHADWNDVYEFRCETIGSLMDGAIDDLVKMSEEDAESDYAHLLREWGYDFPFASAEEYREMWNSMVIEDEDK